MKKYYYTAIFSPWYSPGLQDLFLQLRKAQWHMMSQTWRVIFPSRPGLPPRLPISVKSHNYPPIVQTRKLSVIFFISHLSSLTRLPRPFKTWFLPLFPALFLPPPDSLHLAVITPLQFLEWTSSLAFSVFPVSGFVCLFSIVLLTATFSIPCPSSSSTLLTYHSVLILNVTSFENTSLDQIKSSCWHSYFPQT